MIVTGQHSFPFSSSEELLPAGIMPDTGGLAFAEMLKQTDGHCDITLDQNQNRNLELFNESILNESESYRVVVSGNGEVETEKKDPPAVSDPSESAEEEDADSGISLSVRSDRSESEEISECGKTEKDGGEGKESRPEVCGVETAEKTAKKIAFARSGELSGEKTGTAKLSAAAGKEKNAEQAVPAGTAGGAAEKTETLRKAETVAAAALRSDAKMKTKTEDGREAAADGGKTKTAAKESEAANRLERIITVSVLREGEGKKESAPAGAAENRMRVKITAGEEKSTEFRSDKSAFDPSSLPVSLQGGKETALAENAALRHITKADLIRELKDQGSAEILREAKILVKDGQSGEIKLVLRPQELGTVKINLILENKHIVGRIFVENNIVKEALQTAFGDLKEVFAQQGMELGALDVFVSQESGEDFLQAENEEADTMPFKLAQAVGAVEKHAPVVTVLTETGRINIEV